jgi:crotonobetainyl-CoA:carnitine CoA-transferase CaiB-like acyl-CoA transferase
VLLIDRDVARRHAAELGATALTAHAPHLVHCSVSPFGETGALADLPPDDALVAAASGISAMQWSHGGGPIYLTTPLTAYACGMLTALAVSSALRARSLGYGGQELQVSQLGAAFLFQSGTYVTGPRSQGSLVMRANDPRGIFPTYCFHRCQDDWLFVGALTETFWVKLCNAIERSDLLAHPDLQGSPMGFSQPAERRELVRDTLASIFATRARAEWLARLNENDVPCGPVLDRREFSSDPQSLHAGMRITVDDPLLGPTRQLGVPLRFAATPCAVRGPAPRGGGDGETVLREWRDAKHANEPATRARATSPRGWSDDPSHARNRERAVLPPAPLDGIRVVNLATFIAGALCPMLLADFGAEVIKVEPLDGDPFRAGTSFGFLGWNRGMRSLALDLRRPEGREILLAMAERADLVIDNYRPGVLSRLSLDGATLRARNPRVIQLSITGYGPDGPLADRPCFDPIMQGRSGLVRAQGGFDPTMYTVAYTDYATATMAALAAVAALVARDAGRSGHAEGQSVWTSLLNNAFAMQAGFFIDYPGRPADPPGGRDLRGTNAFRRAYQTSDGWIFVAAQPAAREALLAALGMSADVGPDDAVEGPTAERIAAALRELPFSEALERLRRANVPAVPCPIFPDITSDPHMRANGYWWSSSHPDLGDIVQTGESVKLSRTPMRLGPVAPRLGEHTVEVLRELGLDEPTIAQHLANGIVRQA